jgi:lambda family phage portal protein
MMIERFINYLREKFTYFGGAKSTRLSSDWLSQAASIDRKIYADGNTLRARARSLAHENPLMARSISLIRCNVIGSTGIRLQMKVTDPGGTPDDFANKKIEAGWYEWCKKCGTRGESWIEHLILDASSYAVDGEVFGRIVFGKEGIQVEVVDASRIDINLNRKKDKSQNEIRMGIEIDDWGKMTALWVIKQSDIDYRLPWENMRGFYQRIPSSEVFHFFIPTEPGQTRGYPPIAPVMNSLHQLNGLNEAQLVSARAGAAQMAFFKNTGDAKWTGKDSNGNPEMRIEPLSMQVLPTGYELEQFKPEIPDNYEAFSKSIMRNIAVGIGLSVPALTGDLREVNFSSIRAGNAQDQEYFKLIQKLFIDRIVTPIFEAWLNYNLMNGKLGLPYSKFDKFNSPSWSCKRWPYVNPQQEASANQAEIDMKTKSRTQIVEENGGDIEETFEMIRREEALAVKMGINLAPPTKTAQTTEDSNDGNGKKQTTED